MAKQRAYGADAQLLAALEGAYGTAPDGSGGGVYTKLPFKSFTLGAEAPLGYDPLLGYGRDAQDPYYEAVSVTGDLVIPLDLRNLGFWLRGLFGAPATTDNMDGTYDHVFTSGGELPSLALDLGHTALTTPQFLLYPGAKLGGLTFDVARTGRVNATVPVIAQGETKGAAAADAAPLAMDLQMFHAKGGSIKVDGSQLGNVTGGRFGYSNNLEAVETIRADGLIDGVDETEATAEGGVDVRLSTDATLSDAIDAETPVALEFGYAIPATDFALTFALPRVFLPKKKGEIPGPGGIQASYDWRAAWDSTAGHMLQVTLVNDVAAY